MSQDHRSALLKKVTQNSHDCRFELKENGEISAFAEYELSGNILDIVHTFTSPSKRGQGLASIVCEATFLFAKNNQLRVQPSCSYVTSRFFIDFPQYQAIAL